MAAQEYWNHNVHDRDERIIGVAREQGEGVDGVGFVRGEFLTHPFTDDSFDFACANTALHHMEFGAALGKMARILRPGGRLAVVGLANNGSVADWVIGGAGLPANWYYRRTRGEQSRGSGHGPGHDLGRGARDGRTPAAGRAIPAPPAMALLPRVD